MIPGRTSQRIHLGSRRSLFFVAARNSIVKTNKVESRASRIRESALMSHRNFRTWFVGICIALAMSLMAGGELSAAVPKAKIDEAILKAQQYIIKAPLFGPYGAIAAMAYIKSGGNKEAASIKGAAEGISSKVKSGVYRPTGHHNYEAGVDLMLLEALDGEFYRPQIEAIVAYLISTQQPNGAWFYDIQIEPDCGDTSITQYALLGLWAAVRAGVNVPADVWERAARWQIAKQRDDGGFAYHPFDRKLHIDPEQQKTSATMTVAGTSNLLVIRRVLFNLYSDEAEMDVEVRPAEAKRRFGVLERFTDDKVVAKSKTPVVVIVPTMKPGLIDKALKDSVRLASEKFIDRTPRTEMYMMYYLYSVERVAALLDVEMLGTHNWYDEGAAELLARQAADGSWNDTCGTLASTAFGLMFLSKATMTIVTPKKKKTPTVGGGLQIAGRGLPENLDAIKIKEGTVSARKITGPVDNLLIELERSADAKVEDVQAAVVDAVQLDRPEELIGQTARLRKLAVDARVEVRRTAIWALGRSGDISATPVLYEALLDTDLLVAREASVALCILSRRPEGCGKAIDPTDDGQMGLTDATTDDERNAVVKKWQTESRERWYRWYQKNRPYDERDDKTALKASKK